MFPAFLDTCVLYSSTLRDTLLRIAEADAFRPLWSADVLAELKSVSNVRRTLTRSRRRGLSSSCSRRSLRPRSLTTTH